MPRVSRFQELIEECLRFWLPDCHISINKRPAWLLGLELDIVIFDEDGLVLALEANGRQHDLWSPELGQTLQEFRGQRLRDNEKAMLCAGRGINLVVVKRLPGLRKIIRKHMPWRVFKNLPRELSAEIRRHRSAIHEAKKRWVAFKVKPSGFILPVNAASKDWLRQNPP